MTPPFGTVLKQAREVRGLSAADASRAAGISTAYLSKLEHDAVKKPSPQVLLQLSETLAVSYADLMRLNGYRVPGESEAIASTRVGATFFAHVTDDEREELIEYLSWYRARCRASARRSRKALLA